MGGSWKSGEVLAWTEGDGPGRPPKGPGRMLPFALAGALSVIFIGIVSADTLCPEHRAWVQALGTVGFTGTVLAIIGLLRGWAAAPLLTLAAATSGVVIGLIDALHSPTRGRLVAAGFAIVCLGAIVLALKAMSLRLWDRSLRRSLRPVTTRLADSAPAPESVPVDAETDEPRQPILRP